MNELSGETQILGQNESGEEFDIHIVLGKVYEGSINKWVCQVSVSGLIEGSRDIQGVDSLQALSMAFRFVAATLEGFLNRGGKLLSPIDRNKWPISAYFG